MQASQLKQTLVKIAEAPDNALQIARDSASQYEELDWLKLGAWITAASWGPPQGRIWIEDSVLIRCADTLGMELFRARMTMVRPSDTASISIDNRIYFVSHPSGTVRYASAAYASESLVSALYFARSRLNDALYKDEFIRKQETAGMAADCGLDEAIFQRLAMWESQLVL